MDKQSPSYQNACRGKANPDGDEEHECLNDNPDRRRAVDFVAMKREYERKAARSTIKI